MSRTVCANPRAAPLFARYADAFPPAYQVDFPPRAAVADILRIERLPPLATQLLQAVVQGLEDPAEIGVEPGDIFSSCVCQPFI